MKPTSSTHKKKKTVEKLPKTTQSLLRALRAIVADADDAGVADIYVVSSNVIKQAERALKSFEAKK